MSHYNEPPSRYRFFILGLWQQPASHTGHPSAWRISLEDTQTAQRSGFTTLAELEAFLRVWMEERVQGLGDGVLGSGVGD